MKLIEIQNMPVAKRARLGLSRGLMMGSALCVWVTVIFLLQGEQPFSELGTSYPESMAWYLAICSAAGVTIGMLIPIAKSMVGAYLVGAAAGISLASGIALSVYGVPSRWEGNAYGLAVVVVLVATIAIGNEIDKRRGK